MKPLVSVVVPVHRPYDKLLEVAFLSIVRQTYKNFEILICLNGYDYEYFSRHVYLFNMCCRGTTRYKIVHAKNVSTASEARLLLFPLVRGEYVLFADSDDILSPDCLQQKILAARRTGSDAVFSDAFTYNLSSAKVEYRSYSDFASIIYKHFPWSAFLTNPFPNSSTLVSACLLKYYQKCPHEDYVFYMTLVSMKKVKALFLRRSLCLYVIHQQSLTANKIRSRVWHFNALREHLQLSCFAALFYTLCSIFMLPLVRILWILLRRFQERALLSQDRLSLPV